MLRDKYHAVVIGAGIAGIRSALDLAETGSDVLLIDRAAHPGGLLSRLDNQFPTDGCGMCKMLPLLARDTAEATCLRKGLFHERIDFLPATELSDLQGEAGRFEVRLKQTLQGVDPQLCIGCGACESVCPVEMDDPFNSGLSRCKAIHRAVPHAVAGGYVIDPVSCTRCGACAPVCPTDAIDLAFDQRKEFKILVVDDELSVRDSIKEWLLNEGFSSVETAASGADALTLLGQSSFELLLIDVKMPGMDGVDLLKLAKGDHPELMAVMMTAYATVDTAVAAMKSGALDYLIKPFDPQAMLAMVNRVFQENISVKERQVATGALIVSGGMVPFDPRTGVNSYGYGNCPHVLTSLEFERMLSGCGPTQGRLVRPKDGKPLRRIAWMQCVGSRDCQISADFCSRICCMAALKEAELTRAKSGNAVETTLFYTDMRTFGKSFESYRRRAEEEQGVKLVRARVHSVVPESENGDPVVRYAGLDGRMHRAVVDLVVLSTGLRPAPGTEALADLLGVDRNSWGFFQPSPFASTRSKAEGIFLAGACTEPMEINAAVIQASAAALETNRTLRRSGSRLAEARQRPSAGGSASDPPRILAAICTCNGRLDQTQEGAAMSADLTRDPAVVEVRFVDQLCGPSGWASLEEPVERHAPNRLLVAACHPLRHHRHRRTMAERTGLAAHLMTTVDIKTDLLPSADDGTDATQKNAERGERRAAMRMGLAYLKHADPAFIEQTPVQQRALVIGGGTAGIQAALAIADMGYGVDLVERQAQLGGHLNWLHHTLEGHAVAPYLTEIADRVSTHPQITIHLQHEVVAGGGWAGDFHSTLQDARGQTVTLRHGVTILATGGEEADTTQYGHGTHPAILTQSAMERTLTSQDEDLSAWGAVAMIQCVGSREPSRNYCSRICCPTAVKQALYLKEKNPQIQIFILYRDMMMHGFSESYYTQARRAGVIFIPYDPQQPPLVDTSDGERVTIRTRDPIADVDLEIGVDRLVLATGVTPRLPDRLADFYGAALDEHGFFQEADSKWRPVDAHREGVFACGLALAPQTITEAAAAGQAAAQRALRILSHEQLGAGHPTAKVRASLCVQCERCVEACPYGARTIDAEQHRLVVHPAMCQGCGACAAVCPNGAATMSDHNAGQMMAMIDAAMG